MAGYVKGNWRYLAGAAFLHLLFAGVFALTMIQMSLNAPPPQLAIQGVVLDASKVNVPSRREQQEKERERQRAEQQARDEAAAQQRREQEQAAQQEAEQRAEQERQVEVQRRQEEEQRRVAEEQVARDRQEAERKRQAEAEKQAKADAERKRVVEIERKQQEEAQKRKAAEEARQQSSREEELRKQLAEEEGLMQAESAGLNNQYAALIQQQIERNWNRPPSARPGLECRIRVTQAPNGVVLSAQVEQCNGDAAVKQSIEAAVMRSSPLPPPPDRRLFQRNLILNFKPAD
ncbi:MAG TPA: cell envelope integrity protein TolA [Povalibacter sp.]|nr:cell envelope integrity protein TolA [Povalibacter sp.]